jgi:hypothetical protein
LRAGSESFSFIILSVQDRPDLHVREAIAHCNIKQEERVLLDSGASKTRRMNRTNAKAFGRKMLCLLAFLVTVAKYLREEIEEEVFILGHGFSVSVHHGGEGMIEQSSSHHGGPDRERERERERESGCSNGLSPFSPFIPLRSPTYGVLPPTFRAGVPPSLVLSGNPSQTLPEVCFTDLLSPSQASKMDNHDEHHRHDKQRLFLINQQTVPQADVKTGTHRGGGENVNVFDKQICVLCHRCRPGAGQRQNPGGTNGRISEQKGRGALGTEKEQKWPPVMSRRLKALTPSEPVR